MTSIYQVEFINNSEPNDVQSKIKFYVTNDIQRIIASVQSDRSLDSFTILSIYNVSNDNQVNII